MDTQSLIAEAKARFAHNSSLHYLKEKFSNKLLVADQGGLWKADTHTIAFLNSLTSEKVVLLDVYEYPVEVNRVELIAKLFSVYETIMNEWYSEWKELESKR